MATFYLINAVLLSSGGNAHRMRPSTLVDDAVVDAAAIRAAGGELWPSGDPAVAARAAYVQAKIRGAGIDDAAAEALMRAAAEGANVGVTLPVGTPANQTGNGSALAVFASTVNAGTVAVDTGFVPAAGHGAKVDGGFSVVDRANHLVYGKNTNASLRNFGGLAVAGAPIVSGGSGDGALSTSTLAFSVSGAGTLVVTFTPPGAYVGTLEWLYEPVFTEN